VLAGHKADATEAQVFEKPQELLAGVPHHDVCAIIFSALGRGQSLTGGAKKQFLWMPAPGETAAMVCPTVPACLWAGLA
jgi:hypothetical protein